MLVQCPFCKIGDAVGQPTICLCQGKGLFHIVSGTEAADSMRYQYPEDVPAVTAIMKELTSELLRDPDRLLDFVTAEELARRAGQKKNYALRLRVITTVRRIEHNTFIGWPDPTGIPGLPGTPGPNGEGVA